MLLSLLGAGPVLAQNRPAFSVTSVAASGGASDINEAGDLVGFQRAADGNARGFIHYGGVLTTMGTMGGYASQANSVNEHGVAVGQFSIWETGARAFRYADGSMSDLGTLGGNYSGATGINNAGVIVGMATRADGQFRAFRYSDGVMRELGTLSTATRSGSVANAISNTGSITGYSSVGALDPSQAPSHAFLYDEGGMRDIGTLGGQYSAGYGINERGDVVGVSSLAEGSFSHAFLYRDGVMQDLGVLPGGGWALGRDVNNLGLVVGDSVGEYSQHGFLYNEGMMIDLNNWIDRDSGWEIISASAINDSYQIAATACRNTFDCHAVRLDLIGALPVPEPDIYLLLPAGLGLLLAASQRRLHGRKLRNFHLR